MPKQLGTTYNTGRASAPTGIVEGQTYYDTVKDFPFFYNGTTWKPAIGVLQTVRTEVTANQTTNSATFVDMPSMSQSITTGANFIIVQFMVSCSNNGGGVAVYFRIQVDGTTVENLGITTGASNQPYSGAMQARVAVTAAAHTVKIQWRSSSNSVQVRPVTVPDAEAASMMIWEVTA